MHFIMYLMPEDGQTDRNMRHVFHSFIHSFIHLVVCLTTGPKPLPKRALHIVRSRASSFKTCVYEAKNLLWLTAIHKQIF
jgi:hypothetical protein